ncbi:MAG: hypothetical protein JXA03_10375, partial [Bacteroidales bacterium]|nr:hypothetical protein [Bacteroidales bacterium]
IGYHDAVDHRGFMIANDFISADVWDMPGPWADSWHAETLGSIAFTLEPGSVPVLPSTSRIMEFGVSLAKGLSDALCTPGTLVLTQTDNTRTDDSGEKGDQPVHSPGKAEKVLQTE